jgi:hypothetical protein
MKYYSCLKNWSLCDVKLITFKPSINVRHSYDIKSVYSYFIEHNYEQY